MSKKKMTLSAVVLLVSLLLVSTALAMSSANYRLDWFTPMTSGGGGGPAASANYAINLTLGQTAIGASASANYGACLGYWCGQLPGGRLHLPLIVR